MELNYDEWIHLDAENLAEQGIAEAYQALLPKLRLYVENPAQIEEEINHELPYYAVRCNGKEYVIYSPEDFDSWERATCAFFDLVNEQLTQVEVRFYAINGGNDLGGMFLTPEQALAARASLPVKTDWPYLPVLGDDWVGQYH